MIAAPVLNQRTNDISVALGPDLLLRGLVAALFGAMVSFPLALVGGVVIGVVEGLVLANTTGSPGTDTLVMFILLIVVVLFRARSQSADESAWTLTPSYTGRTRRALEASACACRAIRGRGAPLRRRARVAGVLHDCRRHERHDERADLPDGRGLRDRAHGVGGAALARPVLVRGHRRLPHRVLRAVAGLPPVDRAGHAVGCRGRDRHRPSGTARARPLPRDHHVGLRAHGQQLPAAHRPAQHLLHRLRHASHASGPRRPIGRPARSRSGQGRVLLPLLRGVVARHRPRDAPAANRRRAHAARGARQRRRTPRPTPCRRRARS